jgi:starvation-inducible DNA-binding protein
MYQTRIDLTPAVRQASIGMLQPRLADAVDLFTQIKQAHWNVRGPQFIALHQLFDQVAEVVETQGDEIAERITALGGRADGTARVAAKSHLDEYPLEASDGSQHVAAVADRLAAFGKAVRESIEPAANAGDVDTSDLFTGISREIDKQLWFVEAHQPARR